MDLTTEALAGLDRLFDEHREDEIEKYLTDNIVKAVEAGDTACVLVLVNEMVGFTRDTNQYEKSLVYAEKAVNLIISSGLENTVHHATTLINQANAMRAAGILEQSIEKYKQAEKIYKAVLEENAFDFASLYNNLSLVYMENREFENAKKCLDKALAIAVTYNDKNFEIAVTHANLGNTIIAMEAECVDDEKRTTLYNEAFGHLTEAVKYFEGRNLVIDSHYAAAVMGLGDICRKKDDLQNAIRYYETAMKSLHDNFGYTDFYYRVKERYDECIGVLRKKGEKYVSSREQKGLDICRLYYREIVRPEIERTCPEVLSSITAGLFGMGSDCYGLDDAESRDHDWGPGVCLILSQKDYDKYKDELGRIYDSLTDEFMGYKRIKTSYGNNRVGVFSENDFVKSITGITLEVMLGELNKGNENIYLKIPECSLSALVNGEIFEEAKGSNIGRLRDILKKGYPQGVKYLRFAQAFALFSQNLQYNLRRMLVREDIISTRLMLDNGIRRIYEIAYLINNEYMPHDKWVPAMAINITARDNSYIPACTGLINELYAIFDTIQDSIRNNESCHITEHLMKPLLDKINIIAEYIVGQMQEAGILIAGGYQKAGTYLEDYTGELSKKAGLVKMTKEELVDKAVDLEWKAFDKVDNQGGRADCQDNHGTFTIMRKSQYNVWDEDMLIQYIADFEAANEAGWNLITEKYGRMEQSTAPGEWDKIKDSFPVIDEHQQAIIEEIVKIQVGWMDDFALRYPKLAGNARSIHTYEDNPFNTSYETYLRGEISTYSDTMLKMYGAFIVEHVKNGRNLADEIMEQTVLLYGYKNLADAESRL